MNNSFTKEQLKNSVEYQWQMWYCKMSIWIFLVLFVATTIVPIAEGIANPESVLLGFVVWLCMMAFIAIVCLCISLFYYCKARYLLKNYQDFSCHEVTLNNICTSYGYRGAVYYVVDVEIEGQHKQVPTNPYFSSLRFSKFTCQDYNNKKVVGLYDEKRNKFYVVKTVDTQ